LFGAQSAWRIRLVSRIILRPTRDPLEASHLQRLVVQVRGLKQELFCSTHSLDDPPPRIWFLKIPGSSGRAEKATAFPAELIPFPAAVLTWNPPGYGASEGEANLQLAADLLPEVVEAAVQTLKWATVPMFAMGTSLGGALSVHLCTQRDLAGIILCNPPSLPELLLGYNRWWNLMCGGRWLSQSVPLPLHTISSVQRISTPGVLITSLADQVVPPELQHRIAKNYAGPLKVIEVADADHRLRMADLPLAEIRPAVQWLLSQAGIE
jgi:hypothetical protein